MNKIYLVKLFGVILFLFSICSCGNNSLVFKGRIIDEETNKPLSGKIILTDNFNTENSILVDKSGEFSILLEKDGEYAVKVSSNGYFLNSFHLSGEALVNTESDFRSIVLRPIKLSCSLLELPKIEFQLNNAFLDSVSISQLRKIASILEKDTTYNTIYIEGHCDLNEGKMMSERRAGAVHNYLEKILPNTIKYEIKDLNSLNSGHRQNGGHNRIVSFQMEKK